MHSVRGLNWILRHQLERKMPTFVHISMTPFMAVVSNTTLNYARARLEVEEMDAILIRPDEALVYGGRRLQ